MRALVIFAGFKRSFMLKALWVSIFLSFTPFLLRGQYAEIGLFGGGSNFLGDVGHYGIHLPQGFGTGAFFRYNFDRRWSVRVGGNYGQIRASDAASALGYRQERNLAFRSEIWEAHLFFEFNYFEYEPGTKYWHTPYVLGGIGLFWFDPEARLKGNWYRLQPLGTEGQGSSLSAAAPYALADNFFAFGLGYKFALGRMVSLGIESTFRSTGTDYLDDVSGRYVPNDLLAEEKGALTAQLADRSLSQLPKTNQYRGNPDNRDWYIFTGITIQVKFEEFYEKCANFVAP